MSHQENQRESNINVPLSRAYKKGKYGRLFPSLMPWFSPEMIESEIQSSKKYIQNITLIDEVKSIEKHFFTNGRKSPNNVLPAGYTYFGQFLAHDLSFDSASLSERELDLEYLTNFRTPALDLDSVYGSGPSVSPFFYSKDGISNHTDNISFPLSIVDKVKGQEFFDLPRANETSKAIIPDARNDENIFISQLHTAFLLFHNKVVRQLKGKYPDPNVLFFKAWQKVKWCYQWMILKDYLPKVTGFRFEIDNPSNPNSKNSKISFFLDDVISSKIPRAFYNWRNQPFIPLEFSGAIFRFGHSQVRNEYAINRDSSLELKNAFKGAEIGHPELHVDWSMFFFNDTDENDRNSSMIISPQLVPSLFRNIPILKDGSSKVQSLAARNLFRSLKLRLPSGQDVAYAMGIKPLTHKLRKDLIFKDPDNIFKKSELPKFFVGIGGDDKLNRFLDKTPLWYYILLEAYFEQGGKRLGSVGARITAEVLSGLIESDKGSFVNLHPQWTPYNDEEIDFVKDGKQSFTIIDFLNFAECYDGGTLVKPKKKKK